MAMLVEITGQVGPQVLSDGSIQAIRQGRTAELVIGQAHGRYQEAVSRGNVFFAANTATQALSTNSTTATGLILSNPAGSGKNLVLLDLSVSIASLPAAQYALILTGNTNPIAAATTHTVALVIQNALMGNANNSVAKADSSATIANATIMRHIPGGGAATMASSISYPPFIRDELSGIIMLAPGTCISLQALTTAVTVLASIAWEEVVV